MQQDILIRVYVLVAGYSVYVPPQYTGHYTNSYPSVEYVRDF